MLFVAGVDWISITEILLFLLGFVLIGIEMFIPGLEGPGIVGVISLLAGIFLTARSIKEGVIITIIVVVILLAMFVIIVKHLSKEKTKSPIVLKEEQKNEEGYISANRFGYLLGKQGIAVTDLRPSGTGKFEDVEYDIISEGKYIEKNTKLIVHKVEGSKIIVKVED